MAEYQGRKTTLNKPIRTPGKSNDKYKLFDDIKESHLHNPYRQERDMATMYQQMADSINGHYKL